MEQSKVAVLRTRPQTVLDDYAELMRLVDYQNILPHNQDIILKLNLSWTKFFPACSTPPWQLEGVVKTMLSDGYLKEQLYPVENKTVVTNPLEGAKNNKWAGLLEKYGLSFTPLPEVEWVKYDFKDLLVLDQVFPEGIYIPKMFMGKSVVHLPTVKTHGHSITTGAVKNSFGGLLKEARHYAHKYMHETLIDLLLMQKEIHPAVFAVMDGTIAGDGAGPRTMVPRVLNYILASSDSVAIDAVAAKIMGFDPLAIPYIGMATERGLGQGDLSKVKIVGEDISGLNFGFKSKRSFVVWGDQMLRKGSLKFLENLALRSPLKFWAPLASNIYHDWLWYPTIGRSRIKRFLRTGWGRLFERYSA